MPDHTPPLASPDASTWDVTGRSIYYIGIGGCGMSGLARMLRGRGANCSGSDRVASPVTDALEAEGIAINFDQDAAVIPQDCELVIASAAVPWDHPEVLAAQERGIEVIRYARALGQSMLDRTGIAIAGTHGKSTTTAMLAHVLIACGFDPSFIVGAVCDQIGGGWRVGSGTIPQGELQGKPGLLLVEACEYDRSFHNLRPTRGLITSVESDHLDVYGSLDAVIEAFAQFAQLIPPAEHGGSLLIAHDNAHRREVTAGLTCNIETIGFAPSADWVIQIQDRQLRLSFREELVCEWSMQMPGEHNAMNAACAAALAIGVGADPTQVAQALADFRGLHRRMEFLGEREVAGRHGSLGTVRVYDDYGHHPSEIEFTLRALRQHEKLNVFGGKLICVFQPHQHSRTRFFLEEFAQSFTAADVVIVPQIYFVRDSEAEKQRVSAADLVDRLRSRGVTAMHLYPFDAIVETLQSVCAPGDVLVVMGAGPVWKVAYNYMGTAQPASQVV